LLGDTIHNGAKEKSRMPEPTSPHETAKQAGALLLTLGGVAAAFGAASCCALPILLSSLGVGSAWLVAVAWIASPHRVALLTAALVCLIGGGAILAWHRRAVATCAPGIVCGNRAVTTLVMVFLLLGGALAVAGYLYA
jgi:mercuric ion transport protein